MFNVMGNGEFYCSMSEQLYVQVDLLFKRPIALSKPFFLSDMPLKIDILQGILHQS